MCGLDKWGYPRCRPGLQAHLSFSISLVTGRIHCWAELWSCMSTQKRELKDSSPALFLCLQVVQECWRFPLGLIFQFYSTPGRYCLHGYPWWPGSWFPRWAARTLAVSSPRGVRVRVLRAPACCSRFHLWESSVCLPPCDGTLKLSLSNHG